MKRSNRYHTRGENRKRSKTFQCGSCGTTFSGFRDSEGDVISTETRAVGCPWCGFADESQIVEVDD